MKHYSRIYKKPAVQCEDTYLRVILMANDMIFLGEHVGRSGLPIGVFLVGVPLTCDIAPQFVEGSVEREEI